MQQAPAWLSYASPVIAVIALILSVMTLRFAVLTYHRAGSRVVAMVEGLREWEPTDDSLPVTVTVRNTGLAPVQVVGVRLAPSAHTLKRWFRPLRLTNADCHEGPDIPFTLSGGHQQEWVFDALSAARRAYGEKFGRPVHYPVSPWAVWRWGSFITRILLWRAELFDIGFSSVIDLGNGVQVAAQPSYRLSWIMFKHARRRTPIPDDDA